MTKLAWLSIFMCLGVFWGAAGAAQPEPLKVGVSYPLTGFLASYGEAQRQGVELACEQINAAGGISGRQIKLVVEDNGFEATKQLTAVRKLIDFDKIDMLLTGWTPLTLPILPLINESGLPTFTWMVTEAGHLSPWLFNIKNDFSSASRSLVRQAANDGIRKMALFTVISDELVNSRKNILEEAKAQGIVITADEEFGPNETDFRSVLMRLKASAPQAIFLGGYPGNWPLVVQQFSSLGLDKLRLYDLSMAAPDPLINRNLAGTVEKMQTVSNWYSTDPAHPATKKFVEQFTARFGTPPQPYAAYSYDSLKLMASAAESCHGQESRTCIKDTLLKAGKRNGAAGEGEMDEDGDFELRVALVKIERGNWRYIE